MLYTNDFFSQSQIHNCLILTCLCVGLIGLGIIFINISEVIKNVNSNLEQQPEINIKHKTVEKKTNNVVNVNYTTKLINGRRHRILYDRNETGGTRLRALYTNRRRISNEIVNIDGQVYIGIKFMSSDITNNFALRFESRNPSFHFTQYQMRDGI